MALSAQALNVGPRSKWQPVKVPSLELALSSPARPKDAKEWPENRKTLVKGEGGLFVDR